METLLADFRHSFRVLIKSPGFTVVSVLALALETGAGDPLAFSIVALTLIAVTLLAAFVPARRAARGSHGGPAPGIKTPRTGLADVSVRVRQPRSERYASRPVRLPASARSFSCRSWAVSSRAVRKIRNSPAACKV